MKTIGIIGGMGPETTVAYYRTMVRLCHERLGPDCFPLILINSIDVAKMLGMVNAGRNPEATDYFVEAFAQLARAGADLGLMAANTPHVLFDAIAARCPMPLISIVDATLDAASVQRVTRLGLLGTRATMQGGFYQRAATSRGMTIKLPNEADQHLVHERYMAELVRGDFRDRTRSDVLAVIERLGVEQGVEAVILGGTELPLLLGERSSQAVVPLLDTGTLHAERAINVALG